MKTQLFFLAFIYSALCPVGVRGQTGPKDPVYLEVISNASKTINYTVGVYPWSCKNNEAGTKTYLTMYVMNDGTTGLSWTKMNRVLVVLKDNTLAFNYSTAAETGHYACLYTISPDKGFHEQTLCFSTKFSAEDIANVYLLESGEIFQLMYYKAED